MPPWDEGCWGVEQCCPLGFQPHAYHGSWVMAQGKGLALGPQASAMWPHDFQMAIPGLELTLPPHPSAQNRCRPHLASGKCQLACGCVYGAASDTLVDMLRPGGSETTYSYVGWPWVWGTPELALHVQCGHRLAAGWGGALSSVPMCRIWTQAPPMPPGRLEGSITCHLSPFPRPFPARPQVSPGWPYSRGLLGYRNVLAAVGAWLI